MPQRNLVILLAHGLRSDAIGDSNAWPLMTPRMEKLGKRGLRLVATSACPADGGGLASLLTGLHARQHGHTEPTPKAPLIEGFPAWLGYHGYHVGGVGCVQGIMPWLQQSVEVQPVEVLEPDRCAYLQAMAAKGQLAAVQQQRRQRQRYGPFEPDRLLLHPDDDVDGFIVVQARRMLADMPADQPWALVVMFSGPANDLPPPMLYTDAADPKLLEYGFHPTDLTRLDTLAELDYPRILLQRLNPAKLARLRADYLGRVCLVDFGVGQMMREVARRADADRTWLLLASDRGQLLGEHGVVGHRSFLCPAIETPLILAPPTPTPPQAHETSLISTVDVAATVAALGGCDLPRASMGRSLLPLLGGQPVESAIARGGGCVSEFGRRIMLQTERFKVVFDTESHNALALYDLINDADEADNLLASVTGRNVLDSLRWRLGDALLPLRAPVR